MNGSCSTLKQLILAWRKNPGLASAGFRDPAVFRVGFVDLWAYWPAGAGMVLAPATSKARSMKRRGQQAATQLWQGCPCHQHWGMGYLHNVKKGLNIFCSYHLVNRLSKASPSSVFMSCVWTTFPIFWVPGLPYWSVLKACCYHGEHAAHPGRSKWVKEAGIMLSNHALKSLM